MHVCTSDNFSSILLEQKFLIDLTWLKTLICLMVLRMNSMKFAISSKLFVTLFTFTSWLVNLPPNVPPPRNKALSRPYYQFPLVFLNKASLNHFFWLFFWGGYVSGGRLTSHNCFMILHAQTSTWVGCLREDKCWSSIHWRPHGHPRIVGVTWDGWSGLWIFSFVFHSRRWNAQTLMVLKLKLTLSENGWLIYII